MLKLNHQIHMYILVDDIVPVRLVPEKIAYQIIIGQRKIFSSSIISDLFLRFLSCAPIPFKMSVFSGNYFSTFHF